MHVAVGIAKPFGSSPGLVGVLSVRSRCEKEKTHLSCCSQCWMKLADDTRCLDAFQSWLSECFEFTSPLK
jgi:hypothetical protein